MLPVMRTMRLHLERNRDELETARAELEMDDAADDASWLWAGAQSGLVFRLEEYMHMLQLSLHANGAGISAARAREREAGAEQLTAADRAYCDTLAHTLQLQSAFLAQATSALALSRIHSCGRLAAVAQLVCSLLCDVMATKVQAQEVLVHWAQKQAPPALHSPSGVSAFVNALGKSETVQRILANSAAQGASNNDLSVESSVRTAVLQLPGFAEVR
jgi:hypothetical protein